MKTMNGCDVSNNNEDQDIRDALKASSFVLAKCTEGNGHPEDPNCVDPKYSWVQQTARQAGLLFGAYHFCHPENNVIDEMDWFLLYALLKPGEVAALDFEPYYRTDWTDEEKDLWGPWLLKSLRYLQKKLRCRPWLYLNDDMARTVKAHSTKAVWEQLLEFVLWKSLPGADMGDTYGFSTLCWQWDWTTIDKNKLLGTRYDWMRTAIPEPELEKNMKTKAELVQLGNDMIATDPSQVWIRENSAFGGIQATHATWSEHYLDEAIDVNYGHGAEAAVECYPPEVHWVETVGLPMAVKRGFAVRWMMGPGDHRDHLHADCDRYGLSGVFGHDDVPTGQVEALLKQLGEWHDGEDPFYRSPAYVKSIQRAVGVAVDGVYEDKTSAAVKELQERLKFCGYNIATDGVWGPATNNAYKSFCDGVFGERTVRLWQHNAGTTVDGKISTPSELIKKVQREDSKDASVRKQYRLTGPEVDGVLGPKTWKMIQDAMGVRADGVAGKKTITALQRRLLRGRM